MQAAKVYIVILNYKNWNDSRDCIESVLNSTYTNFSIFLIDNHSGNNSIEFLEDWLCNRNRDNSTFSGKPAVTYSVVSSQSLGACHINDLKERIIFVQNEKNEGFAAGNNTVLRHLVSEDAFIWLLNPDMTIEPDTLQQLVQFAEKSPAKSIIGSQVKSEFNKEKLLFLGGGSVNFRTGTVSMVTRLHRIDQLGYISGGSLFTRASGLKDLGLLPEQYFLYWEETDWCYHARQYGYSLLVCTDAICYDKISTVIGRNYLSDYYYMRNALLFIRKYRSGNIPVVLFSSILRFLKRVFSGRLDRARGVFDGVKDFLKMRKG
jgi:GT2 family glycosyltransferase